MGKKQTDNKTPKKQASTQGRNPVKKKGAGKKERAKKTAQKALTGRPAPDGTTLDHYTDIDQRKEILSVRGLILSVVKDELSSMTTDHKTGKEISKTRALVQAAINQAIIEGEYKGIETLTKMAGVMDTHLLEMNFITDQRRVERSEMINLNHIDSEDKLRLADILTRVEADSFDAVDAVFEEMEGSGDIPKAGDN